MGEFDFYLQKKNIRTKRDTFLKTLSFAGFRCIVIKFGLNLDVI